MKLTHIRHLVSTARRGGLRRAARHLGIAQPAISRSIRELEQELGTSLFVRNTTGMELTPAGQLFYRRVQAIEAELERACDEVRQVSGIGVGTISIGLSTASTVALLPKALDPFHRRYPGVLLRVSEGLFSTMEERLREGSIDFYIGPPNEIALGGEFLSETLFENQRVVIGRKGHPLRGARTLADLAEARWVATSVTSEPLAEIGPLFDSHGLPPPEIAVQVEGGLATMIITSSSDLLALLPRQWTDFAARSGLFETFGLEESLAAPPICVISKASLPLTPVAQHLVDLFRRAAVLVAPEDMLPDR